ncbi:probable methyltransferase PMT3 [Olea europaea subsp. europaea]|uniref:Methyltransferase n=1 Tax=Olea europaea subsp. europaea TaxID=158383 RepID=A0A8S0UMA6_OLEEU|nr:probable methyltransferase PMT3 [Olea europaea subsp. europaea]
MKVMCWSTAGVGVASQVGLENFSGGCGGEYGVRSSMVVAGDLQLPLIFVKCSGREHMQKRWRPSFVASAATGFVLMVRELLSRTCNFISNVLFPLASDDHKTRGSGLAPWPARLTSPPPRLADFGYSSEMFGKDTELWRRRVESYWNLLSPKISSDTLRNVMDMKANLGSFAAALKDKNVWVMNVIPEDGPKMLKIVYDRGLIGTTHNWCEAFSTYPRTYDLLHAWTVFSDIEKKGCSGEDLLLEMDRILRPTGFIIIRDKQSVIEFVKKYLSALHWEAVATADSTSNPDQEGDEVVLVVQKKLWLTSESFRDTE